MTPEQNQLIRKTDIGDIIVSESGDFIDLLYNETTRQAQEKARKIDCEITKKIRQEAIEGERKRTIEILGAMIRKAQIKNWNGAGYMIDTLEEAITQIK